MAKLSLDRALYLPTFSHLLIVNKLLSQSLPRALSASLDSASYFCLLTTGHFGLTEPQTKRQVQSGSLQAVMVRRRRRRPPAGHTTAAGSGGRRAPSLQTLPHTHILLARSLPFTHPFVSAPILQRQFQVRWRTRLPPPRVLLPHTCTQDGLFLQPQR